MKSGWCMVAAAAALSFSTPLASYGQDPPTPAVPLDTPILLRLAPPEGQVSRYVYSTQAEVENPMMPSNSNSTTLRINETHTVLSVEDEVIRVLATIDSASATMSMAMPGTDPVPDFSGSVLTMKTDTRGRMLGVFFAEGLAESAEFDPASIMRRSSPFMLPEEEVNLGDSWTVDVPMSLPIGTAGMSMEVAITYTFVNLEGSLAALSFEAPIDLQLEVEGGGMTATCTMTGTMVVDLAEGRFQSQSSRASFDMNLPGMTMEANVTTSMELVPDP